MIINELPLGLQLLQNSQDIVSIKEHIGGKAYGFDGFFVRIDGGSYKEVYGFKGFMPMLTKEVVKLK